MRVNFKAGRRNVRLSGRRNLRDQGLWQRRWRSRRIVSVPPRLRVKGLARGPREDLERETTLAPKALDKRGVVARLLLGAQPVSGQCDSRLSAARPAVGERVRT